MFLSQDCLDCLIWYLCWLVVWNMNFIFPYIGNCIIPTGEVIFSRGAWWPDCSRCKSKRSYSSMESQFACKPKESRACSLVRKRCWTVMACIGQLDPYNPPNLWLSDSSKGLMNEWLSLCLRQLRLVWKVDGPQDLECPSFQMCPSSRM